jgi:hypothetical protein
MHPLRNDNAKTPFPARQYQCTVRKNKGGRATCSARRRFAGYKDVNILFAIINYYVFLYIINLNSLINAMLNKDPKRRPSAWDLVNFNVIGKNIEKYFREEAPDDAFLATLVKTPKNISKPAVGGG